MKKIKIEKRTYSTYIVDGLTIINESGEETTFNSKKEMAKYLGISRTSLYEKLEMINNDEFDIIKEPSININVLKQFLEENSNGIKMLKKTIIQNEIENGTITTLSQLKEELF